MRALSTAEAEYYAVVTGAAEGLGMQSMKWIDTTGSGCHGVDVCGPYTTLSRTRGADGEFIEEHIRKTLEIVAHLVGNSNRDVEYVGDLGRDRFSEIGAALRKVEERLEAHSPVVTSFRRSEIWTWYGEAIRLGKVATSSPQGGNSSHSSSAPNHGGDFVKVGHR